MSRHAAPPPGARRIPVLHAARFRPGDLITIGGGSRRRRLRVVGVAGELAVWTVPWRWYHTAAAAGRMASGRISRRTARGAAEPRREHLALVATRTASEGSAGLLGPSGAVRLLDRADGDPDA